MEDVVLITRKNLKFFEFNQNNSGGGFDTDDKVCHRVIIEAKDSDEASDIAEGLGIYFNGCESGMDCECCGDRWYRPWEELNLNYGSFTIDEAERIVNEYSGTVVDVPSIRMDKTRRNVLFDSVESYAQYVSNNHGWTSPDTRIFYKNGEVKEFYSNRVKK